MYLYTAAHQDEVVAQLVSGADKDTAFRVNDLLLPIVKGVGSERAYQYLTDSLQTLGGSGFLQDYPIEQYIRDSKIDSLYEGTTAIQAQDFFFRKIARDRGVALAHVAGQIKTFIDSEAGNGRLKAERALLATALEDVQAMAATLTGFLMGAQEQPTELYKVGLGSVRFLMSVGDLLIGWQLLRQSEIALAALDNGASDKDKASTRARSPSRPSSPRTSCPSSPLHARSSRTPRTTSWRSTKQHSDSFLIHEKCRSRECFGTGIFMLDSQCNLWSSALDGRATDLCGQYGRRRLFAGPCRRSYQGKRHAPAVRRTDYFDGIVDAAAEGHELSALIREHHRRPGLTWFRVFVHVDLQLEITPRIFAAAVVLVEGTRVHLVGPLAVTGGQRIRPVVLETRDGSGQRDIGCAAPPTGQGDGSVWRCFGLVPIGRQGRNGHGSDIAPGELEKPLARHERGRLALTGTGDNRQGGHDQYRAHTASTNRHFDTPCPFPTEYIPFGLQVTDRVRHIPFVGQLARYRCDWVSTNVH